MSNISRKYISRQGDSYVFVVPKRLRDVTSFASRTSTDLEGLITLRNQILGYDPDSPDSEPVTKGTITFEPAPAEFSTNDMWEEAIQRQERWESRNERRGEWYPVLIRENKPIGLAWLSDTHFGGQHADYIQMKADAEIIRDTPGMYAEFHGDGTDNWIGFLEWIQRRQVMPQAWERNLFISWMEILKDKLLWVVPGNHDLRTEKLAGLEPLKELIPIVLDTRYIYDEYEVRVELMFDGGASWRIIARHTWPGRSIYNVTHGIERAWKFGSYNFDIAVGGHTHQGTLCRPFIQRGEKKYAILTGTYKKKDKYGEKLGLPSMTDRGSGVSIFWPDGRHLFIDELETAAEFLRFARGE